MGIDDVHIMPDDIIIATATVQEHDVIICTVIKRSRDGNVGLFATPSTIISEEGIKPDPFKENVISNMSIPTNKVLYNTYLEWSTF